MVAIAALEIPETIRLLIQIPLRTEGQTYLVYAPVPVPLLEFILGKFTNMQVDDHRIAVSSEKRSYVLLELPPNYLENCRMSSCESVTPIYERSRETCLSSLFIYLLKQ
jgi:hypothetical protein